MGTTYELGVRVTAIDKATAPLRALNTRLAAINAPFVKLNNSFAALGKEAGLGKLGGALGTVGSSIKSVGDEFTKLAGRIAFGAGLAGGSIFALVKGTADAGDAAAKAAQRAGVTVKAWQELTHAADLSDVSSEDLGKSLNMLSRNLVQARLGSKEMTRWFDALHLKTGELVKLAPDEAFEKIAAQIAALPDGIKKSSIAMGIFGRSGAKLIPLLNSGADGIREARAEAERLGLVFSATDAAASEEFNDNLSRLMKSFAGLRNAIGIKLIPIFNDAIVLVKNWVVENRALIAGKVIEWVNQFRAAWPDLQKAIGEAWAALKGFAEWMGGKTLGFDNWKIALGAAVGLMGAPLLTAIAALGKALLGLNASLIGTPVGLLLLGGAAIFGITKAIGWMQDNAQKGAGHGAHGEGRMFGAPLGPSGMGPSGRSKFTPRPDFDVAGAMPGLPGAPGEGGKGGEVTVHVVHDNPPPGTHIATEATAGTRLTVNRGRIAGGRYK